MTMPVSVMIPDDLRRRIERVAARRTVGVSTAIRALVEERLSELDREDDQRAVLEWQREQALATWAEYERTGETVSWEDMERGIDEALAVARSGRRASPRRSHGKRVSKSRGASPRTAKTRRKG